MINYEINRLINFGLQQGLIHEEDTIYATNMLLGLLKVDEFNHEEINETLDTATPILENILLLQIKHCFKLYKKRQN